MQVYVSSQARGLTELQKYECLTPNRCQEMPSIEMSESNIDRMIPAAVMAALMTAAHMLCSIAA